MLRFILGFILGVLVESCAADPPLDPSTIIIRPAITRVTQPCVNKSLLPALMETLTESRRLMVENRWEFGGFVYEDARGDICISDPATSKHPSSMRLFSIHPPEMTLVAMYHTHPGLDIGAHDFSSTDVMTSCRLNVKSYIVAEDGVVTEFRPHSAVCDQPIAGNKAGRIVGMVRL